MTKAGPTEANVLGGAISRLQKEFDGTFSPETIEETVHDSYRRLAETATVTTYLALFSERFARERLHAVARSEKLIESDVPEVLFVCVHNAGRSQMAAGLLNHRANGRVRVRSAGSDPADRLNPAVVEAMAEIGIDIAREFPKPLTDETVRASDVIITMGCGDTCPIYPGKIYRDWDLPDPASKGLGEVRAIRDRIDELVKGLIDEMATARK